MIAERQWMCLQRKDNHPELVQRVCCDRSWSMDQLGFVDSH